MEFYNFSVRKIRELEQVIEINYGFVLSNFATIPLRRKIENSLSYFRLLSIEDLIENINSKKITKEDFLHSLSPIATEMFRAPSVWRQLYNELSKIKKENNYRIWFPRCAGGYEFFSLIALLKVLNIENNIEITINCISKKYLTSILEGKIKIDKKDIEISKQNFKRFGIKTHLEWNSIFLEKYDFLTFQQPIKCIINVIEGIETKTPTLFQDMIIYRNIMLDYTLKYSYDIIRGITRKLKKGGILVIGEKEKILYLQEYSLSAINDNDGIYKKK